jgi:Ni/Fe-hydrogenase subunit HybB-like protein
MALVCSSVYLSLFCMVATILVIRMDVSFLQHDVDRVMKEDSMQCQVRTSLSYTIILELSVVVKSHN